MNIYDKNLSIDIFRTRDTEKTPQLADSTFYGATLHNRICYLPDDIAYDGHLGELKYNNKLITDI